MAVGPRVLFLSAVLHAIQADFPKSNRQDRSGTAVLAVPGLLGSMHQAKRRCSVAKSDLNNEIKKSCAASKAATPTGQEEQTAKRFMPSSPAFITASPVVFVLTWLSMAGYWQLFRAYRKQSGGSSMFGKPALALHLHRLRFSKKGIVAHPRSLQKQVQLAR